MNGRMLALLYFALVGYYVAKSGLDHELWEKACKTHDRWVLHVTQLARKELA